METFVLRIFQSEVELQCRMILRAWHQLHAARVSGGTDEAWKELQVILTSAANLSKMLWGSRSRREDERRRLRESLQVADTSPLRDPDLRNDFEHFDERLEDWYANSARRNYVGRSIGPFGMIVGLDDSERFQHYDPTTGKVSFWQHEVELGQVIEEIARILPLAHQQALNPHWEDPVDLARPEAATNIADPEGGASDRSDRNEPPPIGSEAPPEEPDSRA